MAVFNQPRPYATENCEVTHVPDDATVAAITAYEAENNEPGRDFWTGATQKPDKPPPIDVRISKPGDVFLMLANNDAVRWRIRTDAGSKLVGVLVMSVNTATVEAPDPAIPLYVLHSAASRMKSTVCASIPRVANTYQRGPMLAVLNDMARSLLGHQIDSWYGDYRLSSVTIK